MAMRLQGKSRELPHVRHDSLAVETEGHDPLELHSRLASPLQHRVNRKAGRIVPVAGTGQDTVGSRSRQVTDRVHRPKPGWLDGAMSRRHGHDRAVTCRQLRMLEDLDALTHEAAELAFP